MSFKDHFSKQSGSYVKYRPTYPVALFDYLGTLTPQHEQAWDCGTGNGQAAIGLAKHYTAVYATDPSQAQISKAIPNEEVTYKTEKAEECSLDENTVDLITIAQALHWFDVEKFYAVAKRVLKKNGIIAAWAYGVPSAHVTVMDNIIHHFHDVVLDPFWQVENRLIEKEYTTIPFPFEPIHAPDFYIRQSLSLYELLGHFSSWSAVQRFKDKNGTDPIPTLEQELAKVWDRANEKKEITWKLILKLGRNS